jgi:hypothetical protein
MKNKMCDNDVIQTSRSPEIIDSESSGEAGKAAHVGEVGLVVIAQKKQVDLKRHF